MNKEQKLKIIKNEMIEKERVLTEIEIRKFP